MADVVVLGSANMDLVATTDRLPGRGETIAGHTFRQVPGGKGANQAIAAARSGGTVRFAGAVGDDDLGRQILAALGAAGVDTTAVVRADAPTGTAHITVAAGGDNTIVVVPGANGTLTELLPAHAAVIAGADTLLLQLELPLSVVRAAAAHARACGVRTVLTPAPARPLPDELLAAVDLLVPNEHEATIIAGVDDPHQAAAVLARRCDVLMTLGERGAVYATAGAEPVTVPAFPVTAVDTTAAGDTFVGVLASALAAGTAMPDAMRRASAAAALSVQRPGASDSAPTAAQVDAFLGGAA
ncbi:ribokinase [Actinocatenispora thailandica]|uniref:Ribokinase n=1 Tax=Actinocatenispora thailandica TaxID=227318 RepID=A0A7R7HY62_9ACTN|nr:ribokinase [Actinocatenispora thailandica]BCJ35753.1 ribokinase [Actinocatenispora thailandica]